MGEPRAVGAQIRMKLPGLTPLEAKVAANILARKDIDDRGRIKSLFRTCFGRPAKPHEIVRSLNYLSKFEQAYAKAKEPKLSAWQSLCKTFIGSNEFIYVE